MSALRGEKPQNELFVVRILCITVLLGFFAQGPGAFGQRLDPSAGRRRCWRGGVRLNA